MTSAARLALLFATAALPISAQAAGIFLPGNLVVSVEGDGSNTGSYADNQAAPLTLYSFSHSGTSSATLTGTLMLPQAASGANHAISGEYGSSSEGGLQLTGDGKSLVIAGYGVNATTFNADPLSFGSNDPTKPGALAQSTDTLVPRVIAVIGSNGSIDTTTALTNVFNQNNPRSVASANGTTFYISGQGDSPDQTAGVFYATRGGATAVPITGDDTQASNSSAVNTTQDTRAVRIVDGQLVVATDSKGGKNNARSYVGTVGVGLPTADQNSGPAMLPGFGNTGGTGKETITAATTNGINAPGQQINLSPNDFFFADPNTLYVADSGDPNNDSTVNSGTSIGDGGLQKWVRNPATGAWSLDYTLAAGLNLVANTASSGATGLLSLTGEVIGSGPNETVELFATNYTIGDTDQTYLYGITDVLGDMTKPTGQNAEAFTELAIAPADTTFKGVAFAPVPEPATYALMISGVGLIGGLLRRRRTLAALA
jgi:PEP-CTERM motif